MEIWEIYMKAVAAYQAKNFNAALRLLDEIKKVPQSYVNPIVLEAYILEEQGETVKAFRLVEKFLPNLNNEHARRV